MFTMITSLDALSCNPPLLPPIRRPGIRPMETDQSQVTMAVTTPTQTSQVGEHPTRKAVPRQLDFTTTMYGGGPPGSSENSVRTTPSSLYGTQHLSFHRYIVMYSTALAPQARKLLLLFVVYLCHAHIMLN